MIRAEKLTRRFELFQKLKARLVPLNRLEHPSNSITDPSNAVDLLWLSVASFDVSFYAISPYVRDYNVSELKPFGEELLLKHF